MSSRLVAGFADALVRRLVADGLVEVAAADVPEVIAHLTEALAARRRLGDAVGPAVVEALLAHPKVGEVYVDDDALRDLVRELPASIVRGPG